MVVGVGATQSAGCPVSLGPRAQTYCLVPDAVSFAHHRAMRATSNTLELSASDLSHFLACRHRSGLDLAVAQGLRAAPHWVDPALVLLQERGFEHERRYVDTLRGQGLQAVDLSQGAIDDAVSRASDAMRAGVDIIIQPALRDGRWFGRPDLLRRKETPSAFGSWSYEVVDTKLAKETRGGTILQLALYSDLLRVIQSTTPEHFHVVTPDPVSPVQTYRVQDFAAYFRLVRRRLEATIQQDANAIAAANYPEPVEHCDVCRWWSNCNKRRHDDDHLTLVASISRLQMRELEKVGITTLAKLGTLPLPLPFSPRRGASDTYVRVREQARIQLLGRSEGHPVHELLPISPDHGLSRLPAPSPGDIFLDLEGDPYARDGGREYLFGVVTTTPSPAATPLLETTSSPSVPPLLDKEGRAAGGSSQYSAYWAHSDAEERKAFEAVVDLILESWGANPGMHVYHYAPYEPSAFKRLMGRYATREAEIDRMLRAELFVDLHAVVKHSLRASVEQYSIKDLEVFYGFARTVDLADARANLRVVERVLELEAFKLPLTLALSREGRGEAVRDLSHEGGGGTVRDLSREGRGETVRDPSRGRGETVRDLSHQGRGGTVHDLSRGSKDAALTLPSPGGRGTLALSGREGTVGAITAEVQAAVEGYNRDDCESARRLREWLERLRAEVEEQGTKVPRPEPGDGAPPPAVDDRARRVKQLADALTADIPADRTLRTDEQHARWLLAHLLDWHRRELKAPWWEFFRLRDLTEAELLDEKAAIAGLRFARRVGGTARSPIDRYTYPHQDTDVRAGDGVRSPDGTPFGEVEDMDRIARVVDIKKAGAVANVHPSAVFAHTVVNSDVLADALLRIAEDVVRHGMKGGTKYRAGRDLLLSRPPRLRGGGFEPRSGESAVEFATRISADLDATILAIQGPPGSGKTFTGARMICELVRRGLRVGITAVSHKVIRKVLDDVLKEARETGRSVSCVQKVDKKSEGPTDIEEVTDNAKVLDRLRDGRARVGAGTAWLWARPEFESAVDVLFVDEAGQMSLANVLAVSRGARSVVLLGDPQQLEQPQQGSHAEGTDVSALEHILQGHQTIPPDRGIFLPETWRLAPNICDFTSEVFYEERLRSRAGLERQVLVGAPPFEGAGLWVVGVAHEGNQNSSIEEAEAVDRIVSSLLREGSQWIDKHGIPHQMAGNDILVVAPYNAHVALLGERLSVRGVRVGTVDRFQGQQAPVVIYSMATSTPEDAPRGMEFLYSLNRLNVATSRAQCACILVASPRLFEPECKSPRQMQLANALCRYVEMARVID
jgi:predicted RecB family nuclease